MKNYFSTRARKLKTGKATLGKIIPDDAPDAVEGVEPDSATPDSASEAEEEDVLDLESRKKVTTDIISNLECVPNL